MTARQWLKPIGEYRPGAPHLVCLPFAGGSASAFFPWAKLATALNLVAVQLPGRAERLSEPLLATAGAVADEFIPELAGNLPQPYALYGHSMGGILAFELTRRIQQQGLPGPLALIVAATRPPHVPPAELYTEVPDEVLLRKLLRIGGLRPGMLEQKELLNLFLPILKADIRISDEYQCLPGPLLECPLAVLCGSHDKMHDEVDPGQWAIHAAGQFRVLSFPGGHFFPFECAELVLSAIASLLGDPARPLPSPEPGAGRHE